MKALKAVIFDMDNTLVESDLDFAQIKSEIGTDQSILEYQAAADEAERERVDDILDRHESRSAASCALCPGASALLDFLADNGIKTALITRNSRKSVETICRRHDLAFESVIAREDAAPKPSSEPVLLACRHLGLRPEETLVVGDYLYDIQAGRAAGAATMLVDGPSRRRFEADADHEVASLHEALAVIKTILDRG